MMFWSVGPFWYMVYGIWYVIYGMKMAFTVHLFLVYYYTETNYQVLIPVHYKFVPLYCTVLYVPYYTVPKYNLISM